MKINELVIEAVKQRLDPKCWKGKHKEGTKIKGGVRVNNCVPNESIAESDNGVISGDEMLDIFKKMHHEHGFNKQMEHWIARHDWSLDTIEPEQLQDMYNDDEDDDPFERTVWLDDAAVTKYERILSAGQLVNPIIMGPNRSVIDGNHRAQAAKNLHVSIPGYVPIKKSIEESKVKPSAKYLKLADALEDYANKHIPKSQPGFGDFMYHAELIRKGHQDVHKQDLNTVQQKYRKTMGDMITQHLDETIAYNSSINEGLTYNDPVSKWIAVFKASTHPKFKGKTAEQREKMARMAQYKAVQNKKTLSESKKRKAKTLIDGMIKSLIKQGRTHDEAVADLKRQVDSRFYEHIDAVAAIINETFDKPYKSKWETSEYGDVDMLSKLPDGTNLSIMFNHEGDDEWQVEFYRDNSQSVTGQGDAQRIFATVINAVQKFVKKHKPQLVRFSATREVEPGQSSQSRAKLYDRIVQRYAHAWGYDMYQEDHGDQVTYELTRLDTDLAENTSQLSYFGNCTDDNVIEHIFGDATGFAQAVDEYGDEFTIDDLVVKYDPETDIHSFYYKNNAVTENFADGKGPGRPGDSRRYGIPKHTTLAQLDKIAHQGGRKGQLAHWQANMRRGRANAREGIEESVEKTSLSFPDGDIYLTDHLFDRKDEREVGLFTVVHMLSYASRYHGDEIANLGPAGFVIQNNAGVGIGVAKVLQPDDTYKYIVRTTHPELGIRKVQHVIRIGRSRNNQHITNEASHQYKKIHPAIVADIIAAVPDAQEIWFHGSRARGTHKSKSDWDFLVIVPKYDDPSDYINVIDRLHNIAREYSNYDIQPSYANNIIARIAKEEGRLLWSADTAITEAIAPHGDSWNELNLMKIGEKPAALVGPQEFEKLYKPIMRKFNWIWTHLTVPNPDSGPLVVGFERYIIGQPGEQARIARMQHLILQMNSNLKNGIKPDAAYHIEMGRLLGYSDADIAEFLKKINM